jgi:hypothetical protein
MAIKIYKKRGSRNYKEKKLIAKLEPILAKKAEENPEMAEKWKPATNYEELQALHDEYTTEEAEIEEVTDDKGNPVEEGNDIPEEDGNGITEEKQEFNMEDDDGGSEFVDPMNREEPKVRDYVQDNESFSEPDGLSDADHNGVFAEPTSFDEAFTIPEVDDESVPQGKPKKKESSGGESSSSNTEPVNPSFNSMSGSKKKKSTEKFAKYIVETVCMLAEKGFHWVATKDINEAKLAEYELNEEMDLSILLTMQDGSEATVKQFFKAQCDGAEELARFDKEEKKDLAKALAEVLLEKGIAPTATQELLLIGLKIFGEKAIMLFSMKAQSNAVLNQLRALNEQHGTARPASGEYTPPPPPPIQPDDPERRGNEEQEEQGEPDPQMEVVESDPDEVVTDKIAAGVEEIKELGIGESVPTIE